MRKASLVCPESFLGSQITSQVYYYYPETTPYTAKAIAQDTYDLLTESQYSMDYTIINIYNNNTSLLQTKIYYITSNASSTFQCFYTVIPGQFPTTDNLRKNGIYNGTTIWGTIPCYSWIIGESMIKQYQYTSINESIGPFIGAQMIDGSQNAYYLFYKSVNITNNKNVFSEPNVQCIFKEYNQLNNNEMWFINKAKIKFGIYA